MRKKQLTFLIFLLSLIWCGEHRATAKEPSKYFTAIFNALEIGDHKLFHEEMRKLLHEGSFEEFMEVMEGTTPSGETIFHGFAKVKKNKVKFAQDLHNLFQLLSFPMQKKSKQNTYTLAGTKISLSDLETTLLAQALISGDLYTAMIEVNKLLKGPAIKALSVVHGTTTSEKTLYGLIKKALKTHGSEEQWTKVQSEINEIQKNLIHLPLQENSEGLEPIEIADKNQNKQIYTVLNGRQPIYETNSGRKKVTHTTGFLSAAGVAWWMTGFDLSELITVAVAGTAGVALGEICYDAFKKFISKGD